MSIEKQFDAAVKCIHGLPKDGPFEPSVEMKKKFYSYYKQATEGACNVAKPPFYQPVQRAKYDCWHALESMSREDAMKGYVEEFKKIVETMSFSADVSTFMEVLGPFYEYVDKDDKDDNKDVLSTASTTSSGDENHKAYLLGQYEEESGDEGFENENPLLPKVNQMQLEMEQAQQVVDAFRATLSGDNSSVEADLAALFGVGDTSVNNGRITDLNETVPEAETNGFRYNERIVPPVENDHSLDNRLVRPTDDCSSDGGSDIFLDTLSYVENAPAAPRILPPIHDQDEFILTVPNDVRTSRRSDDQVQQALQNAVGLLSKDLDQVRARLDALEKEKERSEKQGPQNVNYPGQELSRSTFIFLVAWPFVACGVVSLASALRRST